MLERLRLQNFQTHRDFKLKFDRVTTIVGTSDVGKSSIVRALRWAMQNKPSGDAFVRDGEGQCTAWLLLDGFKVVRRKGKGVNEYIAGDGNAGDEKYKAFGSDVPEQIEKLCNVGEVNFQQQHDSPFWFALTAGQVSKELNTVVNLDVIDRTLANVAKALRKARSVVDVSEERTKEVEGKLEKLSWVPGMKTKWDKLEWYEEEKGRRERKVEDIKVLVEDAEKAEKEAQIEIPDLSELEELKDVATTKQKQVKKWRELLDDVKKAEQMTKIEVPDLSGLKELRDATMMKQRQMKEWRWLLNDVYDAMEEVGQVEERLERAEEELQDASGGVCPLCGGEMKSE